ncbi:MAG: DUF4419 domain-containing protein [Polyangiaceae bacterium]|nr:DUF4419 domain-containing protein [Polyangiaceae bacterium]
MITFAVSDVRRRKTGQPPITLEESLKARSGRVFEAAACNLPNLIGSRAHGLVAAAHAAFCWHYPLVLSPDDVWLCLAQGFATHVKLHAEALRGRFVKHDGKLGISVRRDDFVKGSPSNDWQGMFSELSDRVRDHIGKKRDLVVADFSTTGAIERAASEVVLFDAVQAYFEVFLVTMSGIPEITLLGTVDDWLSIRKRAEVFAEFDLGDWTAALLPILDAIVRSARGDVDRTFWRSFFKWKDESGGPYVNGWVNVLFPYVKTRDFGTKEPEPVLNLLALRWEEGLKRGFEGGTVMSDFPNGLSFAPFPWQYLGTTIPMVFMGGFAGVSQDVTTGAVRPAIGWAIGEQ